MSFRFSRFRKSISSSFQALQFGNVQPSSEYTALDPNGSEIRLVTLEPGEWNEPIHCSVHHAKLDDKPKYEALSYVWGNTNDTTTIHINKRRVAITRNLAIALQYLRLDKSRVLWIDSISINQSDIKERSVQILKMREIYSSAARVLSWLGSPSQDSDVGMRCIEELANIFKDNEKKLLPPSCWTPQMCDQYGFAFEERNWTAILHILGRDYWTRVWIYQEISCSGPFSMDLDRCLVGCGRTWLSKSIFIWFDIMYSCLMLSQSNFGFWNSDAISDQQEITLFEPLKTILQRKLANNSHSMLFSVFTNEDRMFDLSRVLWMGRKLNATDPRDRIYGLLGVSNQNVISKIAPDYSKSPETVFVEAFMLEILNSESLDCLRLKGLNLSSRHSKHPTWAMNYLNGDAGAVSKQWLHAERIYCASGRTKCLPKLDSKTNRLTCRGYPIGCVTRRSCSMMEAIDFKKLSEFVDELAKSYPDTLWRALVMDVEYTDEDNHVFPAPDDLKPLFDVIVTGADAPEHFQSQYPPGSDARNIEYIGRYSRLMEMALNARCVFETDTGYVGLGPAMMKLGDEVAVLLGSDFPFVLKSMGEHYSLIGDAYVQGVMRGELVFAEDGSEAPGQQDFILY